MVSHRLQDSSVLVSSLPDPLLRPSTLTPWHLSTLTPVPPRCPEPGCLTQREKCPRSRPSASLRPPHSPVHRGAGSGPQHPCTLPWTKAGGSHQPRGRTLHPTPERARGCTSPLQNTPGPGRGLIWGRRRRRGQGSQGSQQRAHQTTGALEGNRLPPICRAAAFRTQPRPLISGFQSTSQAQMNSAAAAAPLRCRASALPRSGVARTPRGTQPGSGGRLSLGPPQATEAGREGSVRCLLPSPYP